MNTLRGIAAMLLISLATLVGCVPLYLFGLLRMPLRGRARHALTRAMHAVVQTWAGAHRAIFRLLRVTRTAVRWDNADDLSTERWYLVVSNHQSWADILILQSELRGRVPILKFFTKRELIWVPLIGVAMWFLGFPYVRRLSREQLAADPSLAGIDRQATLDACRGFQEVPTAVLAFLEGTRFTAPKHAAQDPRFDHLLNPKLGGASYVAASLGPRLHKVLDVTIVYPEGVPSFWELLKGECPRVDMLVQGRTLPGVPPQDPDAARELLRPWVEAIWREKDQRLGQVRERARERANGQAG